MPDLLGLIDRALEIARYGLPVFPLWWPRNGGCSCRTGTECRQPGKHPRILGWQIEATTDEGKIRQWWARWPTANIGVATGRYSDRPLPGILILDVDVASGGAESLAVLEAAHAPLPDTVEVITGKTDIDGRRGRHVYFRHPGIPIGNSVKKLGPGLDTRCDGGLVVGAGSVHASGLVYEWEAAHHPEDVAFAEPPSWLLDLILLSDRPTPVVTRTWSEPEGLPPVAERIERARRWLAGREPAIQGQGGSSHTMGICAVVTRGFALESDEDAALALADWNARCCPAWDDRLEAPASESLLRKIREGRTKGQIIGIGEKLLPPRRVYFGGQIVSAADAVGNTAPGDPAGDPDGDSDQEEIRILAITGAPGELSSLVRASESALHSQPLYAFGGNLVTVRQGEGGPSLLLTAKDSLRVLVNRVIGFAKPHGKEFRQCWPPDEILGALLSQGSWNLPEITGIVETPTIRPDGTILDSPGFDPQTGLMFISPPVAWAPVPESPSQDDLVRAFACLGEPLRDFPFQAPHHRAAAIAAIITAVIRPAIAGPVPMFLFDATTPGTGKGLLVNVVATIATGRRVPIISPQADEEEMRKLITSLAMEGARMVVFDNVSKPLGGPTLDAGVTSCWWQGRLLGTNRTFNGPLRPFWGATGNNIQLKGDMPRRVVPVRMASPDEEPESRQDFAHPDLLAWVGEHRASLVASALTIVRAYVAAGRPRPSGLPCLGGFELWDDLVRAPLLWQGAPDILEGRREMRERADQDTAAIRQVVAAWHRLLGSGPWTLRGLKRYLDAAAPGEMTELKDALIELAGTNDGKDWMVNRAGYLLRRYQGRTFEGKCFVAEAKDEQGVRWRVEAR
ncbi:MAG: bifunctional DNA primase/polymerase [Cyanobacteria bacterium REEB65]|nr:bifunctional DNA primase/polymerase [Cyanobacteria bacterium REEB65]